MINIDAFFKISYGLYIVSSGDAAQKAAFVANAAFQVTAEPAQFAVCCNKKNYSADIISKKGAFALSVLHQDASMDIIGTLGYKSGRDTDKFKDISVTYGQTGVPIITTDCVSVMEFRLVQTFEVGTHYIFIGELLASEVFDKTRVPITYDYYRNVKKGMAPKNAPTYIDKSKIEPTNDQITEPVVFDTYKCNVCGFQYAEDAEGAFDDLPHDWACPICGVGKDDFSKIN